MSFFKVYKIGKSTLKGMMWLVWMVRFALMITVTFILVCIIAFSCASGQTPSVEKAPYSVIAVLEDNNGPPITHIYYAGNVYDNGARYVLTDYWQQMGKRYYFQEGEKTLIKADWSRIGVYRRS